MLLREQRFVERLQRYILTFDLKILFTNSFLGMIRQSLDRALSDMHNRDVTRNFELTKLPIARENVFVTKIAKKKKSKIYLHLYFGS